MPSSLSDPEIEAFLRQWRDTEVRNLRAVGHGEWSKAYTFEQGGDAFVVRFSALDEDFLKDRVAARFASADLPIPPILDMGQAFGGFYAIAPRALGTFLDDLDRPRMQASLPALFRALDTAREVDVSASTGYGGWGVDGTAPHPTWRAALLEVANDSPSSRTHGWRERLASLPAASRSFERGLSRLGELVDACPEQRFLVHADLLNYNVLVADDGAVSAVLDWGCSLYGDFLYDVAWLAFFAPWYPAWDGIDFAMEAGRHYAGIGLDVPDLEARLKCYQVHIGLDSQAYNAFKGRLAELDAVARRTLQVAN